jgi:hypothetical protein
VQIGSRCAGPVQRGSQGCGGLFSVFHTCICTATRIALHGSTFLSYLCFLFQDRKYELKDVTEQQSFHENEEWYQHLNFTAKSKGADGLNCGFDKQFFVELKNTRQEGLRHPEWVVTCFCMVETNDNGILYILLP